MSGPRLGTVTRWTYSIVLLALAWADLRAAAMVVLGTAIGLALIVLGAGAGSLWQQKATSGAGVAEQSGAHNPAERGSTPRPATTMMCGCGRTAAGVCWICAAESLGHHDPLPREGDVEAHLKAVVAVLDRLDFESQGKVLEAVVSRLDRLRNEARILGAATRNATRQ